ncbi:DUF4874 domain-containing protein, partial [Herbaspirillum sp. GCM10030257]|uniref:DUF4874 domain-containing protein n=1 Tax=Herbaspirillum sp. GCM10030257 TaxID=3273393 RepID=UPI0036224069
MRYGLNGTYAYRTATGSIACNNATFGDPLPGTIKACDYASTTTSTPAPAPAPTPTPAPAPAPTPTPAPAPAPAPAGPLGSVSYTTSTAQITNPERGFYRYVDCNYGVSQSELQSYRNGGNTLVYCIVNLSSFINSPISQTQLDLFQRRMDEFRSAGLKAIPRFVYSENEGG